MKPQVIHKMLVQVLLDPGIDPGDDGFERLDDCLQAAIEEGDMEDQIFQVLVDKGLPKYLGEVISIKVERL